MAKNEGIKFSLVILHALLAIGFMALITFGVFEGSIKLSPSAKQLKLSTFGSKLEYVFKYQTPALFMILLCVTYVIRFRAPNPGTRDPLSGNEVVVQPAKNILTNTVEQYLLHLVSQLILISYLDAEMITKITPLLALFFFIGRIAFIIGYPHQRGFGFFLCWYPNIATTLYCVYKFLIFTNVLV